MRVRDFIARCDDDFLDLDVPGIILVAMTPIAPSVASTVPPDITKKILSLSRRGRRLVRHH